MVGWPYPPTTRPLFYNVFEIIYEQLLNILVNLLNKIIKLMKINVNFLFKLEQKSRSS